MTGMGMGSVNPAVLPSELPFGNSKWAPGFWFDLITQVGAQGTAIVGLIASLAGSNQLSALSNPLINDTAVGGQRGCYVEDTGVAGTQPRFSCNAVSPYFANAAQPFCFGMDFRQTKVATMPLWSCRSSTGVTDAIFGSSIGERAVFQVTNSAGVTTTITGTIPLTYDYHRIFWDYDGTTLRIYVDGILDQAVVIAIPALNVNRFTILAAESTAVFAAATGFSRRFFFTPSSIYSIAGFTSITQLDAYLIAQDYTLPLPLCPSILLSGDSIQLGYGGSLQVAGTRAYLLNKILTSRMSIRTIGQYEQGTIQNRLTSAQGGDTIESVSSRMTTALNAVIGLGPYLVGGMAGTNNLAGADTYLVMASKIAALLNTNYPLAASKNPDVKFFWSTLTPINPAAAGESKIVPFNTELTKPGGVFDSFKTTYGADKLIVVDNYSYIAPWDNPARFIDNAHPNVTGDNDIGAGQWTILESVFRSISPT